MNYMMRHLIKAIIIVEIAFWAQSSSAAIQWEAGNLTLTNPSLVYSLEIDSLDRDPLTSLTKDGPGAYLVNVDLTNTGDTIINGGVLGFQGGTINLQNVLGGDNVNFLLGLNQRTPADSEGSKSTLFVADGTVLNSTSIVVDSLIIGGSVKNYFPGTMIHDDLVIPEPSTIIIWSLLGALGATVGWWRRTGD